MVAGIVNGHGCRHCKYFMLPSGFVPLAASVRVSPFEASCSVHGSNLRYSMGLKWRSEGEVVLRNATLVGATKIVFLSFQTDSMHVHVWSGAKDQDDCRDRHTRKMRACMRACVRKNAGSRVSHVPNGSGHSLGSSPTFIWWFEATLTYHAFVVQIGGGSAHG